MSCQKLQEALTWKSKRVGPCEPFEKPEVTEPAKAWDASDVRPPSAEVRKAQQDAQDHFWDWAKDLARSTEMSQSKESFSSRPFGSQHSGGTPPSLPPRFSLPKPSEEKEEYFQNFAQELCEAVGFGMPNEVTDDSDSVPLPPPPPPKRPSTSSVTPPPEPPPFYRRGSLTSSLTSVPALAPRLAPERIEVRVDQAFSNWANDFALAPVVKPQGAPPPPPRPPVKAQLPLPPPRPPMADRARVLMPPFNESQENMAGLEDIQSGLRSAAFAASPHVLTGSPKSFAA